MMVADTKYADTYIRVFAILALISAAFTVLWAFLCRTIIIEAATVGKLIAVRLSSLGPSGWHTQFVMLGTRTATGTNIVNGPPYPSIAVSVQRFLDPSSLTTSTVQPYFGSYPLLSHSGSPRDHRMSTL